MSDAELLSLLSAEAEAELALALSSAFSPAEIDPARHERILELALEDPLAPPSTDEIAASERLRQGLAEKMGSPSEDDAAELVLARALAAAHAPERAAESLPDPDTNAFISRAKSRIPSPQATAPKGRIIYAVFGGLALTVAAAAALVVVVGSLDRAPANRAKPAALAVSRSSAALFDHEFSLEATTARVDRIASQRERELRQNMYVAWGVR